MIAGVLAPNPASGMRFEAALVSWECTGVGGTRGPTTRAFPSCVSTRLCICRVWGCSGLGVHAPLTACVHMCVEWLCALPLRLLAGVCFHRCLSLQVPLRTCMYVSIFAPVSFSTYISVGPWLCMFLGVCAQRQGEARPNTPAQGRRSGLQMAPPQGACGCVCQCVPARAQRRHEAG